MAISSTLLVSASFRISMASRFRLWLAGVRQRCTAQPAPTASTNNAIRLAASLRLFGETLWLRPGELLAASGSEKGPVSGACDTVVNEIGELTFSGAVLPIVTSETGARNR